MLLVGVPAERRKMGVERGREKKWRGNSIGREKQNRFTTSDNSVSQRLTSQLASFISALADKNYPKIQRNPFSACLKVSLRDVRGTEKSYLSMQLCQNCSQSNKNLDKNKVILKNLILKSYDVENV